MKKRILAILLAALMILSLLPTMAFAAEYTDTKGHWGERAIDRWSGYGVVAGKGDGVFDPDGLMKRAESAQVFANLFKLTAKGDLSDYTDVGLGKWYDDAIAKCVAAGILSGKGAGTMDPEGTVTREEFFVMFARALGVEPETAAKAAVADGAQAASWAAGYITALVNRGYVKGTGSSGSGVAVQPKLNINRASVMSLLNQTIDTYVNTAEKVTAGDGLTLIVADNARVAFAKGTEDAEVYVFAKNAAITNAPVGTIAVTSEDATGTRVNGKAFSEDATTVVKKETPSGGGDTPYTPPTPPAPTTYTVTFDVQGHGSAPASQTVAENGKVTEPTAPTADGWTFGGWYKDAGCTDDWDFATDEVTANTTLYAKWTQMTIADVLATVAGGFPVGESTDVPPSDAWVCGVNYAYKYGAPLFLRNVAEPEMTWIPLNTPVEVDNGFYKASTNDYVITFNMVEDKLVSFVYETKSETSGADKYNGTYAPAVSVTSVSLNITELGLTAGDEDGKLTATVLPENATNKAVTWQSSDSSIATVDQDGKVHAVAAGDATITVTTVDGNKTASCDVTVAAPATTIETVAGVLATNPDFPTAEANAWTNTNGKKCYLNGESLLVADVSYPISSSVAIHEENDYRSETVNYVLTFNMINGVLTSITAEGFEDDVNGTYAPESQCIAAGTIISMPGGKQKAVEELEIGDIICTFDHETGEVSSAPVCFIWESKNVANAFTLTFEDDVEVTVIEEHGFYDKEEQKYVFINLQNAEEYIGHHFYNADTNSWLELKNCEALSGNVDAYAIITSGHLNHMSNGMLSMCDGSVKVLANIFEYDDQMKFDADKKKADIETYGLTSKEKIMEFEGFFESDYDDYNLQYLNVAIGKGLTTWEWIKTFSDYCVANGL